MSHTRKVIIERHVEMHGPPKLWNVMIGVLAVARTSTKEYKSMIERPLICFFFLILDHN